MDAFLKSIQDAFQDIINFITGIIAQIQNAIDPKKDEDTDADA